MTTLYTIKSTLYESGPLTLEALVFETGLPEDEVMEALGGLMNRGKVVCGDGVFSLFDSAQSKRIKNGLLVKSIPSIG